VSRPEAELAKLAEEVETCTRCDLHCNTTHGVPGDGPPDARIMFVGEAPGRNEDLQGRPFVGAAGKFLQELLAAAGLTRDQVYITNVVKHRPTQPSARGGFDNRAPTPEEIDACRTYLDRQMEIIRPRLIVTLGRFSVGAFFPGSSITRSHGTYREKDGLHFFHSYHPAAALYNEGLRSTMVDDMRKLGKLLEGPLKGVLSDDVPGSEQVQTAEQDNDDPNDGRAPEQLTLL
jgi:DNA polymerase